ncbi:FKBP-type peptidyl-prolyl cis-trans isomerase [Actinoplanes bogorensis]|uniref:Peptidyl-prolyl cis-trans isomerase n=1 Tax=Paractinoplanes bogorensis TaxID=1610840 RepID=A0ABS5Z0Q7_9ACTN|nr:FKBP-type peptidyl-prolyl cis-trans isomerase [Actinoplanes bogorensis]MBU2669233.1 FKBP-type peptidyl-prolyl cis-trans isomerase [Actinoplanes bogorensis]
MSTETARPITGDKAKRRTQAVAGAVAGVAVIAVLVTVFVTVRGGDPEPAAQPAAAAPSAEAVQPTPEAVEPEASAPAAPEPAQPAPVNTPDQLKKQPVVKAGTGTLTELKVTPLVAGRGPAVKAGQTVTANYVLVSYKTGQEIDSSWKRGEPFSTPIGTGQVIQGWDKGIPGQKVGSRIQIDVPAAMAYGPEQGDLRFVVDILAAK